MNGERFKLTSGIKVKHLGFKGAADAGLHVIAGRIHFAIVGLASSLPFIRDGRLIALAMGTPHRSSLLPDVPTIAETLPGYARDGSHSMVAPKGTPIAVLLRISEDVKRVLEMADVKQRLENIEFVAAPTTPDEHDRIIRADLQTFTGVLRLAGLRPK
jgi:tripartite-type tricarboxylate transporter receptor subunit TctC